MADEHAQVYSADERIQQEGREPSGCRVAALRALQFCARAPELARYPGDGSAVSNRLWSLDELVERTSN